MQGLETFQTLHNFSNKGDNMKNQMQQNINSQKEKMQNQVQNMKNQGKNAIESAQQNAKNTAQSMKNKVI